MCAVNVMFSLFWHLFWLKWWVGIYYLVYCSTVSGIRHSEYTLEIQGHKICFNWFMFCWHAIQFIIAWPRGIPSSVHTIYFLKDLCLCLNKGDSQSKSEIRLKYSNHHFVEIINLFKNNLCWPVDIC